MRIVRKRFMAFDDRMKRKLRYATFTDGYLRQYMRAFPGSPAIVIFANKHIMGWALGFRYKSAVNLSIFVNKRYRRHGVATLLVEEALKMFPRILLAEWDVATRQLFRVLRAQHPSRIRVYRWSEYMNTYAKFIESALP